MERQEFLEEYAKRMGTTLQEAEYSLELYEQQGGPVMDYDKFLDKVAPKS